MVGIPKGWRRVLGRNSTAALSSEPVLTLALGQCNEHAGTHRDFVFSSSPQMDFAWAPLLTWCFLEEKELQHCCSAWMLAHLPACKWQQSVSALDLRVRHLEAHCRAARFCTKAAASLDAVTLNHAWSQMLSQAQGTFTSIRGWARWAATNEKHLEKI